MKKYLLIIPILLITSFAHADYFIVNQDNIVIGKTQYEPDAKDLESRKEIAVKVSDNLSIEEAEYRNGKIIKHVETSQEISLKAVEAEAEAERAMINKKMKAMALAELKKEGKTFKHVKDEDYK